MAKSRLTKLRFATSPLQDHAYHDCWASLANLAFSQKIQACPDVGKIVSHLAFFMQEGIDPMETRITVYVLQSMLQNRFRSKKEMAASLDIQYRMLLRVFSSACSKRDLRLVMDRIVHYHIKRGMPMDNTLQGFFDIS